MKRNREITKLRKGYAPQEAFDTLGIGSNLGYRLIREGVIPSVKLGTKRIIIPTQALDKLLEDGINSERN